MSGESSKKLLLKIAELENRLAESEQLIEAIRAGEVDAFAVKSANNQREIYTLQSGDYAYRVLIEEFGEGAINLTEDGLIVYTNTYFSQLIELPYEKVIGSLLFDFIHKDSKEHFKELFIKALKGKSKGEINLEVNYKIIPVYVSLTSLQPTLATVGIIITDFSEKKKHEEVILRYQKELEAKNFELVRSNAELASFAYIASHDLQEPLRKIQTFSDRILDKEEQNFSLAAKDNFKRILSATTRMQELINALLNYSRTNTADVPRTPTDLNILLKDVKSNLFEIIEKNHVIIEAGPLPVLNVIPLQFYQVFSNIIGNAIKYRKRDETPLIKISADTVPVNELTDLKESFVSDKYWKIDIADNGIGFEQIYADKIFGLFQRLYGRSEYEGTGIGLAICKKIVQNHQGFIKAFSEPNSGSTFTIYLPHNN